jgi:hypothetical protein
VRVFAIAATKGISVVCGCIIVSIMVVIPIADNLNSKGIQVLSCVVIGLALDLWRWNDARAKTKPTPASPPERQSS